MQEVDAGACYGIVLAGGRSSRMGVDKAELLFHGTPLLSHMRSLLVQAGLETVWISGNYPGYQYLPDFPVDGDGLAARGPLAGLLSMASHLRGKCQFLVVVPVDMPLLSTAAIVALFEHSADIPSVAYEQAFFPLRLALDDHLIDQLQCLLGMVDGKSHSIRALLERLPTRWLPLPENSDRFGNVNTPEQWQALQRKLTDKPTEN